MKRMVLCLLAAVVMAACASGVMAATPWIEDFNGYTDNVGLPWVGSLNSLVPMVGDGIVPPGLGNDGTKAVYNNTGVARNGFRAIDGTGAGFVFAQMRVSGSYSEMRFGVFETIGGDSYQPYDTNGCAFISLSTGGNSFTNPNAQLWDGANPNPSPYSNKRAASVNINTTNDAATINPVLATGTWADVMIAWSEDHKTFAFSYKKSGDAAWIATFTQTVRADFAIGVNYVGFGVKNGTGVDNIGFNAVPEPGSMVALLSGITGLAGFAIRRRK